MKATLFVSAVLLFLQSACWADDGDMSSTSPSSPPKGMNLQYVMQFLQQMITNITHQMNSSESSEIWGIMKNGSFGKMFQSDKVKGMVERFNQTLNSNQFSNIFAPTKDGTNNKQSEG